MGETDVEKLNHLKKQQPAFQFVFIKSENLCFFLFICAIEQSQSRQIEQTQRDNTK